jgi:hypothetical protein
MWGWAGVSSVARPPNPVGDDTDEKERRQSDSRKHDSQVVDFLSVDSLSAGDVPNFCNQSIEPTRLGSNRIELVAIGKRDEC